MQTGEEKRSLRFLEANTEKGATQTHGRGFSVEETMDLLADTLHQLDEKTLICDLVFLPGDSQRNLQESPLK